MIRPAHFTYALRVAANIARAVVLGLILGAKDALTRR